MGFFSGLVSYLSSALGWLATQVWVALVAQVNWLWLQVSPWLVALIDWLWSLVPPEWAGMLSPDVFPALTGSVASAFHAFTYFFPVYLLFGMWSAGMVVCGAIRVARWIKSFVPTIGD